jgi:hypothetical protein
VAAKGQDVVAAERRVKAARLRAEGKTYREIGVLLSVSHVQALRDVRAGLKALHGDLKKQAATLVRLEWERLELPLAGLLAAVQAGDPAAVETWRRLSESRRKLVGLDAPDKAELSGPEGSPLRMTLERAVEADREAEEWERGREGGSLAGGGEGPQGGQEVPPEPKLLP